MFSVPSVVNFSLGAGRKLKISKTERSVMMTTKQIEGIRRRVLASIESVERGEYVECEGRDDLQKLAERVKARGRRLLAQEAARRQMA